MIRWTAAMLVLALAWGPAARAQEFEVAPDPAAAEGEPAATYPRITLNLKEVPFRQAVDLIFTGKNQMYTIHPEVPNTPITVNVRDLSLDATLRMMAKLGGSSEGPLTIQRRGDLYEILPGPRGAAPGAREQDLITEKIAVSFIRAQDLVAALQEIPVGVRTLREVTSDNSILVQGTPTALEGLKRLIRLHDIPVRSVLLRVSVTGPGAGGRALLLQSSVRSVLGKEVTLDEQFGEGTQMARMKVILKTTVLGDETVLVDSDWDLSLPVGSSGKGPVRLVKRLATTSRIPLGGSDTVGEVDAARWGGSGTVKLSIGVERAEPRAAGFRPEPTATLPRPTAAASGKATAPRRAPTATRPR